MFQLITGATTLFSFQYYYSWLCSFLESLKSFNIHFQTIVVKSAFELNKIWSCNLQIEKHSKWCDKEKSVKGWVEVNDADQNQHATRNVEIIQPVSLPIPSHIIIHHWKINQLLTAYFNIILIQLLCGGRLFWGAGAACGAGLLASTGRSPGWPPWPIFQPCWRVLIVSVGTPACCSLK